MWEGFNIISLNYCDINYTFADRAEVFATTAVVLGLYLFKLSPTMPRSQRGAGGRRGVGRGIAHSNGGGRTRYNILLSMSI